MTIGFPPDPGFISEVEATRRIALPEYDRRNRFLERLWDAFLNRQNTYRVIRAVLGHGPSPGVACFAAATSLEIVAKDKVLSTLARLPSNPLRSALAFCDRSPHGIEGIVISNQEIRFYQDQLTWKNESNAKMLVARAFGRWAYENMAIIMSQVAKDTFDLDAAKVAMSPREHAADLFAAMLFLPSQLSTIRSRDKCPHTLRSREKAIRSVIVRLS